MKKRKPNKENEDMRKIAESEYHQYRDLACRNTANPTNRANACEQERNQRGHGSDDGEENGPAGFFDSVYHGFAAVARAPKVHAE